MSFFSCFRSRYWIRRGGLVVLVSRACGGIRRTDDHISSSRLFLDLMEGETDWVGTSFVTSKSTL